MSISKSFMNSRSRQDHPGSEKAVLSLHLCLSVTYILQAFKAIEPSLKIMSAVIWVYLIVKRPVCRFDTQKITMSTGIKPSFINFRFLFANGQRNSTSPFENSFILKRRFSILSVTGRLSSSPD